MLGMKTTDTNDVRYRDLVEYAAMSMLLEVRDDLKKKGVIATASKMREFRDNWSRNGQPMDFGTMKAGISDFATLLQSTGATSFGSLDKGKSLKDGIKDKWVELKEDYDAAAATGMYLHTTIDPVLREHILDHLDAPINRGLIVHEGKSARELSVGDSVEFRARKDASIRFPGTVVGNASEQQSEAGFAGADVVTAPTETQKEADLRAKNRAEQAAEQARIADLDNDEGVEPEKVTGWNSGSLLVDGEEREFTGMSDLMGAYFTKADAEVIAKNMDSNKLFDANTARNGAALLKHMRSSGYDFNVKPSQNRNQIEVRLNGVGEKIDIRIFDDEMNGSLVGRVYDSYNTYRFNTQASNKPGERKQAVAYNTDDAVAVLDYITGRKTGTIKKSLSGKGIRNSQVKLQGIDRLKSLQVNPIENQYREFSFEGETDAKEYIETGIADAKRLVEASFNVEAMQALIDKGLDDENIMVTGPEFQAELEPLFAADASIREAQERAISTMLHSDDGGLEHLTEIRDKIVGDYESGFNPAFVIEHMVDTGRGQERNAMMAALKTAKYDLSKISGNDFAVNAMKERLVTFNPETAKNIDEVEHPMLKSAMATVRDTLKSGDFIGIDGEKDPRVLIDDQGVIRWEGNRRTGSNKPELKYQHISAEIGQIMAPDENGIIKTQFQGDNNYGVVPGYTGYFSFDGDYDNRMNRFRVKGFDQHMDEKLKSLVTHQMTRPIDPALKNIPATLDASGLNGLYHGDVYGKRVDLDFLETNQLPMESKEAILKTLSSRVRFDNQFSDYATTSAETQANRDEEYGVKDEGAFSYWKAAGGKNMRVLQEDVANYADTTMTGTGKTQGLIWFLADGAEVNKDGSVTPSKGMLDTEGKSVPDSTALQKLPYFEKKLYNAWDRNQMSSNQLMTALRVDENVNTALMSFGGWTFEDSYAVSKEFADRNQVLGAKPNEKSMDVLNHAIQGLHNGSIRDYDQAKEYLKGTNMLWSEAVLNQGVEKLTAWSDSKGTERLQIGSEIESYLEEHGRFRSLQRGDKLSDFGGNKGVIGIVIDRDLSPGAAKSQKLEKEVAFLKANPKLDVISAPYSMMSRHNAGVVKELMDGETEDLINPETGEVMKAAMGKLNIIVTDMVVDDKTHAYSREDVLDGKGRKASGQLAWALQSKGAEGIMNEIYGRNDSAWSTYREYLIATGLDMKPDGTLVNGYTPHAGEERHHFGHEPDTDSGVFLEQIKDQGGFLDVPFDLQFKNGNMTNEIPVLSASLRQNVELVDGSMRVSNFTNYYAKLYDAVGEYNNAETDEGREKSQEQAQNQFDAIQSLIVDRQFNGGHNGKNSFIRDKIMGKRMQKSATAVAIADPRLDIGEAGMNQEMMDALDAKEGDMVMTFRDPVWRDGAIRSVKIVKDESAHGIAFNPIAAKSFDGDFDGDTFGVIKFDTKEANNDLKTKFSHEANMIDYGSGKDELYFQSGMDLASAQAKATEAGDTSPEELLKKAHANGQSDNPKLQKAALRAMNEYSNKLFREYGFGSAYVSLESDDAVFESFGKIVKDKAKGNAAKLEDYKQYHNGEKTAQDGRDIQYASGVKSDDTGLAGAFSQKLIAVMRNSKPTAALESMYPLTQGTLQIKHDAKHAKIVNKILTDDMNKTFNGKNAKNSKQKLSKAGFKSQFTEIMDKQMKVDVNPKFVDELTEAMTVNGQIAPLKDVMAAKGSPMDRVAYGGGYEELKKLANTNQSLLTGEQNKLFAPFTMRNATDATKLAKRDTQRVVIEETPVLTPPTSAPKSTEHKEVPAKVTETEDVGLSV